MQTLRIDLLDDQLEVEEGAPDARLFWDRWNSPLTADHWCRTETDPDGNPYTIKWHGRAFRNGRGVQVCLTLAMMVDGIYPSDTRPKQPQAAPKTFPATQPGGQLAVGKRLRSPAGTWEVSRSERVAGGCLYLLTHEDGHQEEWRGRDMAETDFHLILTSDQQTLI